ncbi:MAG: hypothetical protein V3V49_04285 [Candidatus Krumholzibacteria bacterium]
MGNSIYRMLPGDSIAWSFIVFPETANVPAVGNIGMVVMVALLLLIPVNAMQRPVRRKPWKMAWKRDTRVALAIQVSIVAGAVVLARRQLAVKHRDVA